MRVFAYGRNESRATLYAGRMRRTVRAGVIDQRDRATKRRRDRRLEPATSPSAHDALRTLIDTLDGEVDPNAFLRASSKIDLAPAERLRVLAIEREFALPFDALKRIYERAIALDPDAPWVYASFGIAASEHARLTDDEGVAAQRHRIAIAQLERATAMAPEDAGIAAALGLAKYVDPSQGAENALSALNRALQLDPSQPWACLYRAHALHDLGRWGEAADAYAGVPKASFDGPRSWRMHLLVEQRAWCRLQSGDRAGALEDFERILGRYEAQLHLAQWGDLQYAKMAAKGQLPELKARVETLNMQHL